MSWPANADGDVFRRLQSQQFDFTASYDIDFNVDFDDWPPSEEAIQWLQSTFQHVVVYDPTADFGGYIKFKVNAQLTYEFVVNTQDQVSLAMAQHGGVCESWGVLHGPAS